MTRWFRFYDDAINDPKILRLSDAMFRAWVTLLCLASKYDGILPTSADIALMLRMKVAKVAEWLTVLTAAGLLDCGDDGTFRPHNWNARQYKSDVSTERVKRFRKREGNVSSTVSETPPETEQIQSRTDSADAGPKGYAFESGVIKLNQRDFDLWQASYSHIELRAELLALTNWAGGLGPKRWFHAVQKALANKNREVKAAKDRAKESGGFKWPSGIEGVI